MSIDRLNDLLTRADEQFQQPCATGFASADFIGSIHRRPERSAATPPLASWRFSF